MKAGDEGLAAQAAWHSTLTGSIWHQPFSQREWKFSKPSRVESDQTSFPVITVFTRERLKT
jgi:hypothetical protein